jgi:hypothetical protein
MAVDWVVEKCGTPWIDVEIAEVKSPDLIG